MQALKKIIRVKNRQIFFELPDDFQSEQVEVIILPYLTEHKDTLHETEDAWKQDFLSISKWENDNEAVSVSSWPIEQF